MIATLIAAAVLASSPPQDPPALFAQFRENRARFATTTIHWTWTHRVTDDGKMARQLELAALEAKLEALDALHADPMESRKLHQAVIAQRQEVARAEIPTTRFQTFLADGAKFMLRTPPPNWNITHADDDWLMPNVPVTIDSLATTYRGFSIQAYAGDPNAGIRDLNSQANFAHVHRQTQRVLPRDFVPPLASQGGSAHRAYGHAIDLFFEEAPGNFRGIGTTTIDGRDVVVIEKRVESSHTGGLRSFQVVRAAIDPKRGALPLRIEWFDEQTLDDKLLPHPKGWRPRRLLEVGEIREIAGGGFYPTRGADQIFGDDPQHQGSTNTREGQIAGNLVEIRSVLLEETTWHAAKVLASRDAHETFALPFPGDIYTYNEITGYSGLVRAEFRNDATLPWSMCGAILAGWVAYGVIATLRRRIRPRVKTSTA